MVFSNLLQGFIDAISPINIFACFIGALLGTVTGVLPGIGPAAAMALLLPITFGLPPTASLIMLAGIYYGAMYGGSTTSILLNIPGETASVVTCFDGYQMAKKGRAGAALAVVAIGSWVAGTLSTIGLMFFAPPLAQAALAFGPPEYFAVALLGLLLLNNLTGDSFIKATLMMVFGLMLGTVGMDMISGYTRFTFGVGALSDGIELVPVLMGLFGLAEVLTLMGSRSEVSEVVNVRFRELYPTREELKRSLKPILRGTAIGFPIGLLPGPAHVLSTMVSYKLEKSFSRTPEEFGKGAIEGVAGPESANNAASTGAMIPLFGLGIPFSPGTAILISALMIHGVSPSPLLISQHPRLFWAVIASMYLGNVMLLVLNLPFVSVFASMIKIPAHILMPIITGIMLIGAYSINNNVFDVWVMVVFGVFGYLLRKVNYPTVSLIIGLILGPMFEESLRQGLLMTKGSFWLFFHRPIAGVLLILAIFALLWGVGGKFVKRFIGRIFKGNRTPNLTSRVQ